MRANNIPVVFSESTVSPDPAQQVARETGAKYGGVLYVDSLSEADGPVPTYLDLLRVTSETIAKGLGRNEPSATKPGPRCRVRCPARASRVEDITVTYRNGQRRCTMPASTSRRGTITALVGVNGSGKSTLFKAIMGFVPLARGEISCSASRRPQALKKNLVAYVPQSEEVDWNFPVLVEDVVMMGRYGHMNLLRIPRAVDHEAVEAALARVGMSDFRKRQIGELSGGQKKRVFLARALAQDGKRHPA